MEIFKNIAAVVGCISACIALLTTIIKPLRQRIIEAIMHKSQYQNVLKNIEKMNGKIDILLNDNKRMQERLERVEENVLINESDRLKAELSNYYNKCCRGLNIFPEEFLYVEEVYHKYSDVLHQNHIGTNMYDFIAQYYKEQDFIKSANLPKD